MLSKTDSTKQLFVLFVKIYVNFMIETIISIVSIYKAE